MSSAGYFSSVGMALGVVLMGKALLINAVGLRLKTAAQARAYV